MCLLEQVKPFRVVGRGLVPSVIILIPVKMSISEGARLGRHENKWAKTQDDLQKLSCLSLQHFIRQNDTPVAHLIGIFAKSNGQNLPTGGFGFEPIPFFGSFLS